MKRVNVAIRKHAKAGADAQIVALGELGYGESIARKLLEPDFAGRVGFADYETKNKGANIRRLEERLEAIKRAKAAPVTESEGEGGVRMEDNPADNRVRLFFPDKPSSDVRATLKAHGLRWAPTLGCWQAYGNPRSFAYAQSSCT
jgi:hypothetical protein